jgi:hypothetical protein
MCAHKANLLLEVLYLNKISHLGCPVEGASENRPGVRHSDDRQCRTPSHTQWPAYRCSLSQGATQKIQHSSKTYAWLKSASSTLETNMFSQSSLLYIEVEIIKWSNH